MEQQHPTPWFAGHVTFLRGVSGRIEHLRSGEVAVFGLPNEAQAESGLSNDFAAACAIREASVIFADALKAGEDYTLHDLATGTESEFRLPFALIDLGNISVPDTDTEDACARAIEAVWAQDALPVMLGGPPQALVAAALQGWPKDGTAAGTGLGYVRMAAELRMAHPGPSRIGVPSGGSTDGGISPTDVCWIGANGLIPASDWDWAHSSSGGAAVLLASEVNDNAPEAWSRLEEWLDAQDALILELDLGVIDAGYSPGAHAHNAGGLTPRAALAAVEFLTGRGLRAIHVTGLHPAHDQSGRTAYLAFELALAGMRVQLRKQSGEAHAI